MSRSDKGKRHEKFFNQFSFYSNVNPRISPLETYQFHRPQIPHGLATLFNTFPTLAIQLSSTCPPTKKKNPLFIFPADSFTENPYLRLISPRLQSRPLFTKTSRIRRALSRAFIKTLSVSYGADQPSEGEKKRKRREKEGKFRDRLRGRNFERVRRD